jgi:Fur family transcriptional regulator, zinc uptake regulator
MPATTPDKDQPHENWPHGGHDHRQCVSEAITTAEALCLANGEKLTPLRRQVLELVWASHAPVGAYDLLERLSQDRGRVAPPTVYRALSFLVQHQLVHRIDSLNAFVGCPNPGHAHEACFLICTQCKTLVEATAEELRGSLHAVAKRHGFSLTGATLELRGLCPRCAEADLSQRPT